MEVGFVGLFALVVLFFALARMALELLRTHWLALALLAQLAVTIVLGFFATVLQLRLPTAILWLTGGSRLALLYPQEGRGGLPWEMLRRGCERRYDEGVTSPLGPQRAPVRRATPRVGNRPG